MLVNIVLETIIGKQHKIIYAVFGYNLSLERLIDRSETEFIEVKTVDVFVEIH